VRRRLLNLLTGLSLLLCVAACVMWARGRTTADHVRYSRYVRGAGLSGSAAGGSGVVLRSFSALSAEGAVAVSTMRDLWPEGGFGRLREGWRYDRAVSHPDRIGNALAAGFGFGSRPPTLDARGAGFAFQYRGGQFTAVVPWWCVAGGGGGPGGGGLM
jgi:hypothetical protein